MAKHELIAKSGVINVIMALEQSCDDRQDFYIESTTELDARIDSIPTFTEQEIVNPVLDKIRAEINKLTVYYTTKDKGINLISQKAVNRIFDKYKAESEVK